ncbi:hypothetical protein GF319_01455 [Candidatus Bathyarchaeota archaeon]|nr:hypothetical protein [Candidatus Bathyarchaeota archaeon]
MHDMRVIAPTVCDIFGVKHPGSAEKPGLFNITKALRYTDRLAVVVIDAFGVSTWNKAKNNSPTINLLESINSTVIHSVMKSITPVNFATMLTGAHPEVHKITDRTMHLRLETIFDILRESGMNSSTAARSQSSLGILISPHADHPRVAESNLDKDVTANAIASILDGENLLWVQLLDVDDAGHRYGPYSQDSIEAVRRADTNLRRILEAAGSQDYSVIVLADHGQHTDPDTMRGTHGTDLDEDLEVPLFWATSSQISESILGSKNTI